MNIEAIISELNSESDEKIINNLIAEIEKRYREFFACMDKLTNDRKLALTLSIISRNKTVADYMANNNIISDTLKRLIDNVDVKVRKNTYSCIANLNASADNLMTLLDGEDSYINIVHLMSILSHYRECSLDFLKKNAERIDKNDAYYQKAQNLINKITLSRRERIYMVKPMGGDNLLLTTSANGKRVLMADLKRAGIDADMMEKVEDGIIVSAYDYAEVKNIRSYYEMLIVNRGDYYCDYNERSIASKITDILDLQYFNSLFDEVRNQYSYRIEFKGNDLTAKERNTFVSQIVKNIHSTSFVNVRDNYDIEIRLSKQNDRVSIAYKIPYIDKRFIYRKRELPASINPVNANIIAYNVKKSLKGRNNLRVLDGFMGTGTMLYELYQRGMKGEYVGVDIDKTAVSYARENIGDNIPNLTLINSDILSFEPKEKFDLFLSNLPFGTRVLRHDAVVELYAKLVEHLDKIMNSDGLIVLLTTNAKAIRSAILNSNYMIISEQRIESGGLVPYLIYIKKKN